MYLFSKIYETVFHSFADFILIRISTYLTFVIFLNMVKQRSFPIKMKLEAIEYLKTHSVELTAKKFLVDPKRIRDWRKDEAKLKNIGLDGGNVNKRRMDGGGRKIRCPELEIKLRDWIKHSRERRLRVSRRMIQRKVQEFQAQDTGPSIISGMSWVQRFMVRNNLVIRKRTTISQKLPHDVDEKLTNFIVFLRDLLQKNSFANSSIFVMDETPVWIEPVGTTSVDTKGKKEIPIKSTGHEKVRITVILTARADGKKCKPYIVIPRKRPIPELEKMNDIVCVYQDKSWMDDDLTKDYLNRVVGKFNFGAERLMIWDSFRCHISDTTKTELQKMKMKHAVIPGGCTGLIQAPDVSWNKSLKSKIEDFYEDWMVNGQHTFTAGGNMRAPTFPLIARWVADSWNQIPTEQIQESMKQCAITTAVDGSEDELIQCIKNNPQRAELLKTKMMNKENLQFNAENVELNDHQESSSDEDESITDTSGDEYCDSDEPN